MMIVLPIGPHGACATATRPSNAAKTASPTFPLRSSAPCFLSAPRELLKRPPDAATLSPWRIGGDPFIGQPKPPSCASPCPTIPPSSHNAPQIPKHNIRPPSESGGHSQESALPIPATAPLPPLPGPIVRRFPLRPAPALQEACPECRTTMRRKPWGITCRSRLSGRESGATKIADRLPVAMEHPWDQLVR